MLIYVNKRLVYICWYSKMVMHLTCNEGIVGSSPTASTIILYGIIHIINSIYN